MRVSHDQHQRGHGWICVCLKPSAESNIDDRNWIAGDNILRNRREEPGSSNQYQQAERQRESQIAFGRKAGLKECCQFARSILQGESPRYVRIHPSLVCLNCSTLETAKDAAAEFQDNRSTLVLGRAIRITLNEFASPRPRVEVAVPA